MNAVANHPGTDRYQQANAQHNETAFRIAGRCLSYMQTKEQQQEKNNRYEAIKKYCLNKRQETKHDPGEQT